jgi:hypothetical protein
VVASVAGNARAQQTAPRWMSIDLLALDDLPADPAVATPNRSVADGTSVRIRGFAIYSQANGEIDFHSDSAIIDANNNINLESTLGMDLDKFTGGALLGFNFGHEKRFHLDFTYQGYYDYEGSRDVGSIVFNGKVFTGEVDSSAQLAELDIDFRYDFWKPESVDLTLSGTLGLRNYFIQAKVQEVLTGRNDSVEFIAPIPVLGGSLRWGITPNVYVQGNASGIYLGEYGNYYDLSAEVGVDLNRNVGLFLGYRFWAMNLEWDNDDYDFDNGAIYSGVEMRF